MRLADKVSLAAVVAFSVIVFFGAAFSTAEVWLKALAIVGVMTLSGVYLQRVTGSEGRYGVVMIRGKNGLGLMKSLGDSHPQLFRRLADFGLSMSFGLPYGAYLALQKNDANRWRDFVVHVVLAGAFFWWMHSLPYVTQVPWADSAILIVGLLLGFFGVGMLSLFASTTSIFASKTAVAGVQPVVPGLTVPWEAIAAIVIIAVVHEVAHGVLARIEKVRVKSAGAILWGFLPIGAFVEPDEEAFAKVDIWRKRRVLVAGSTSNFVFFVLFFFIALGFGLLGPMLSQGLAVTAVPTGSIASGLVMPGEPIVKLNGSEVANANQLLAIYSSGGIVALDNGTSVKQVPVADLMVTGFDDNAPAASVLDRGDLLRGVNNVPIYSTEELRGELNKTTGPVTLSVLRANKSIDVVVDRGTGSKLGIAVGVRPAFTIAAVAKPGLEPLWPIYLLLVSILAYTTVLNLALAIVNVLPIFITDGHRIIQEEFVAVLGRRNGIRLALLLGLATLLLMLVNLGRWFKVL